MDFINKKELAQVVFVSGATRSGKIVLSRILSSLDNFENIRVDHLTEQLAVMNKLGEISDEACITLLKYSIHFMTYDNYVGRNSNFKPADYTSIWNTPNPKKYFERLFSNNKHYGDGAEGDKAIKNIKNSKLFFHMMIHYELMHVRIFLKAFPKCKIYHLRKHPVDLIFSWLNKGYGKEFYQNPRVSVMSIKYKNFIIPYYAVGWEEQFIALNETDKVIYMINHMNQESSRELAKLSFQDNKRVTSIYFDDLVMYPDKYIKILCEDLNTNPTHYIDTVFEEENIPRIIENNQRQKKLDEINNTASKNGLNLLSGMIVNYERDN